MTTPGTLLAIETSCDETSAAVLRRGAAGPSLASCVILSQDVHRIFGGVVPELASRAHLTTLGPVVDQALAEAGVALEEVDAIAVTAGPGLVGALLVGVMYGKTLARRLGVPLLGVHHLEGHLFAPTLEDPTLAPPFAALLVSGGHTLLLEVQQWGRYRLHGTTRDDAAGEAFDKVARFLGLGYPGGPAIDALAMTGDPTAVTFPRAMLDQGWDFSFSGLKTSVINHVRRHPEIDTADVAASFQAAVCDVLVAKARRAAREIGAAGLCLAGGVAANSQLREAVLDVCVADGLRAFLPSRAMCTDNAAMVAAAAYHRLRSDGPSPADTGAVPGLRLC